MSRKKKDPIRKMTEEEFIYLNQVARAFSESSSRVARAKVLLIVSDGASYQEAALRAGRRSAQSVSKLVSRFNQEGIEAINIKHAGGPSVEYGSDEKQKITNIISSPPDRKTNGTATWSLSSLQRHLEKTEMGHVSTYTLWKILHNAGYSFQKDCSWVKTGIVSRKRGGKFVEVEDVDSEAKKKSNLNSV